MAEQLDFRLDSPLLGQVKNERTVMAYNFFSLEKGKVAQLPTYDDGQIRIEVRAPESCGVATIYDKEFLIYVASLIQDKLNRGEVVNSAVTFTGHDFFRVCRVSPGGSTYDRISGALERLQGTQIKTNIETGGEGTDEWFSWVKSARAEYRKNASGERVLKRVTLELCDWLHRAILKDNRMLTYDPAYFDLSPLQKRLYEIARAHCGYQRGFRIRLEKLQKRVGSARELKKFAQDLRALSSKRPSALPEYHFELRDPAAEARKVLPGQKTPRVNLQNVQVFFFRIDKLREIPAFDVAPLVDEE